jgi:hypothetical protein
MTDHTTEAAMYELKDLNDLIRIANAGGGWEMEAGLKSTNDLIRLANAAGGKGRLVLSGMAMRPTEDLIRIANAGQGSVFFKP